MSFQDTILQGDVIEQLRKLPGDLVDCIVTSPPYWSLRDYGVDGQIGMEEHPKDYINKLVEVFHEVKRVLKPAGTVFLNIGDTYYGKMNFTEDYASSGKVHQWRPDKPLRENLPKTNWLQPKQKLLIPERIAIAMQEQGWILRNSIIWYKTNHMCASVTDRLTCAYEPVFFFTKSKQYYFNLNAIRKAPQPSTITRNNYGHNGSKSGQEAISRPREAGEFFNPLGANPGDMWSIATESSKSTHIATFPTKLVKQCIKCGCPDNGLVMDIFAGSGTTLYVARRLARHYLGIELNEKYVEIARRRLIKSKFMVIPPEQLQLVASYGGRETKS